MNKKIKREWLKALRSGEYAQGKGVLCEATPSGDRFCCLGVLIDSCVKGEWVQDHSGSWAFNQCYSWLPKSASKMANIAHRQENTLAKMNDNGCSFAEIADYIEANL